MSSIERYVQEIIDSKEIVSKEEYEAVVKVRPDLAVKYLNKIEAGWLNINVYSEHDHEKRQFEMETS